MRIGAWASAAALLALAAACSGHGAANSGRDTPEAASSRRQQPTVMARTEGGATRIDIRTTAGATHTLTVPRDSTVAPTAEPTGEPIVVAGLGDSVLIVSDAYPSIPGGMSVCQAGVEHFLRVISLTGGIARERYRAKTASCRTDVELAELHFQRLPDAMLVRLRWLTGPAGVGEVRTLHVAADGAVRVR
jgi:hypothetical protein